MSLQDRLHDILGFEDATPEVVPVVVTPEEHAIVAVDGEIAVADATVAEHEQEINQVQADMDSLEERVEDLEENIEGLESLLNGSTPWNPELAQKYFRDARKIYQRSFKITPDALEELKGAESFVDVSTAEMELAAGLEEMKKGAGGLVEGVKKFFTHLFNVVIAFFVGIFNKLSGLERKADLLVTRLNSVGDDKIKDTIKLGGWNAYLDVEKSSSLESKSTAIVTAANGFATQSESALVEGIKRGCDAFAKGFKQTKNTGGDNVSTITGRIAAVEFTIVEPKGSEVAAINKTKVTFKVVKDESVKTSGEYKSGKSKSALVEMAKKTKSEATATKAQKLTANDLKSSRDKAISAAKSDGGEGSKDKVAKIKAANKAMLRTLSAMVKYQANLIAAQQSFIAAHV